MGYNFGPIENYKPLGHHIDPESEPPKPAAAPQPQAAQPPKPVLTAPAQKAPQSQAEPKTIIDQVAQFIARYLQCTEHERNVLALWVLHTRCFSAAQVTPYLSISSSEKQSGKSLCLQLLSLLCPNPALSSGFTAATLSKRTDCADRPTFLLDEAQITLGSRARSKNPTLRACWSAGSSAASATVTPSANATSSPPKPSLEWGLCPNRSPTALSPSSLNLKQELRRSNASMQPRRRNKPGP
jgi:hypothetical protein